jgi:hypothetical protein
LPKIRFLIEYRELRIRLLRFLKYATQKLGPGGKALPGGVWF